MIIPDTNLLVYAHREHAPEHPPSFAWWQKLMEGSELIGLPWEVSISFVRIMTKPQVVTDPPPPGEVIAVVEQLLSLDHVVIVEPGPRHLALVAELLTAAGTGDKLVPDAHIAALAIQRDAEVHTNDRDFSRFPGLRWRNPLRDFD